MARESTRNGTFPERGKRTAKTIDWERRHILDLDEQGLGTQAIANKTGRSTHTVHSLLTHRGTRALFERNSYPTDEESAGGSGRGRSHKKREDSGAAGRGGDMTNALIEKLGPQIVEAWTDLRKSYPEFLRQVVGSIMVEDIPIRTMEGVLMEIIGYNPALRREWEETRLQQIKRNGRSEMDIVGERTGYVFEDITGIEAGCVAPVRE